MTRQVFADGISRIRIVNGTVRLDFGASVEVEGGVAAIESQVRVVMSVKGFVEAHRTMQQAMAALIQSGAVATPRKLDQG